MRMNLQPWLRRQLPSMKRHGIIIAEHLTLCFSLVNITLVSLFVITTFAALVFWIMVFVLEIDMKRHVRRSAWKTISDATQEDDAKEILVVILIAIVAAFVSLLFSAALVHGVWQKKPNYIKVYFCYGIVTMLLTLIAVAYYLDSINNKYIDPFPIYIVLSIIMAYASILSLIYVTYQQYKTADLPTEMLKYGDQFLFIETNIPKE